MCQLAPKRACVAAMRSRQRVVVRADGSARCGGAPRRREPAVVDRPAVVERAPDQRLAEPRLAARHVFVGPRARLRPARGRCRRRAGCSRCRCAARAPRAGRRRARSPAARARRRSSPRRRAASNSLTAAPKSAGKVEARMRRVEDQRRARLGRPVQDEGRMRRGHGEASIAAFPAASQPLHITAKRETAASNCLRDRCRCFASRPPGRWVEMEQVRCESSKPRWRRRAASAASSSACWSRCSPPRRCSPGRRRNADDSEAQEGGEPVLPRRRQRRLGRPPAAEVDPGRRAHRRRHRRRHGDAALPQRGPARDRGALRLPRLDARSAVHAMNVRLGERLLTREDPREAAARGSSTRRPSRRARRPRCSSSTGRTCSR